LFGENGKCRRAGLGGAGGERAIGVEDDLSGGREVRATAAGAAFGGFNERRLEGFIHGFHQSPGAFVAHAHLPAGRGDGAGSGNLGKQIRAARTHEDRAVLLNADTQVQRHAKDKHAQAGLTIYPAGYIADETSSWSANMPLNRRTLLVAGSGVLAAHALPAWAGDVLTVAFAGSMGIVMDQGIGPAFQAQSNIQYQGIGQAALGLAHLLAAKSLIADVFIPVSPGPVKVVEEVGLVETGAAVPVASTQIVLAYSPKSKFAREFAAAKGSEWLKVLQSPGLQFGRTDPNTDPQGQYVLYTMQLAALYYKQPALATSITGPAENSDQIFPMVSNPKIFNETSLLTRLQEGQVDATLGYQSAIESQKLPYISLPAEINFSTPALSKDWYSKASLTLTQKGVTKTVHPGLLVFYAAALKNAANPAAAAAFLTFLTSKQAAGIFAEYGYGPPKGKNI
jgi:molybdate/tungstate transport system substrate-binding protein